MTDEEFDARMRALDQRLGLAGVPALQRSIAAWFLLTSGTVLHGSVPPDPSRGPYEEPNLIYSIDGWYKQYYPEHSVLQSDWGPRLILIRGEVFQAQIPLIFNATAPLDPYEWIEGLSASLRSALTEDERATVQHAFNVFYVQASDLAMCFTVFGVEQTTGLLRELLAAAWADLKGACASFRPQDAAAVLFPMQQATEKYLKAYLVHADCALTDDDLRKRYGHNIRKLLQACQRIEPAFEQCDAFVPCLDHGADVRYRRPALSVAGAVHVVDVAHAICHLVARILLKPPAR